MGEERRPRFPARHSLPPLPLPPFRNWSERPPPPPLPLHLDPDFSFSRSPSVGRRTRCGGGGGGGGGRRTQLLRGLREKEAKKRGGSHSSVLCVHRQCGIPQRLCFMEKLRDFYTRVPFGSFLSACISDENNCQCHLLDIHFFPFFLSLSRSLPFSRSAAKKKKKSFLLRFFASRDVSPFFLPALQPSPPLFLNSHAKTAKRRSLFCLAHPSSIGGDNGGL